MKAYSEFPAQTKTSPRTRTRTSSSTRSNATELRRVPSHSIYERVQQSFS